MTDNKKRYRYPGARQFEKEQSPLFFGRENDIEALYRLIKLRSVVTLYGKSGTGKSSLINAGIIPKTLNDGRFVPLVVRFKSFSKDGDANVMPYQTTQQVIRGGKVSATTFLDRLIKDEDSLWHDVKEHFLRHQGERGLLLIFDQFEELFSYDDQAIQFFQEQLNEALYTEVPQRYWDALKQQQDNGVEPLSKDELHLIQQAPQVKIVLSIRVDRLHLLNRLSNYLPNILKNNYELTALDNAAATTAILSPATLPNTEGVFLTDPFTFEPAALTTILNYLTKNGAEKIESTQLQIICNALEKQVIADKLSLIKADEMGDLKAITGNFYAENIAALPQAEQLPARLLIEDHLIFEEEERRLTLYEGKILKLVSPKTLDTLVDNHLLRAEPSLQGGYTYELSHDTLVAPVLEARMKRLRIEREAEDKRLATLRDAELTENKRVTALERRKRRYSNIATAFALVFLLVSLVFGWQYQQKSRVLSVQSNDLLIKTDSLQRILNEKKEAVGLLSVTTDSLSEARQAAFNNLTFANEQAGKAQIAILSAQAAQTNADSAQANALRQTDAADKARLDAEKNKQEAEDAKLSAAETLRLAKEKEAKILEQKQTAEARADKNEAMSKDIEAKLQKAQAERIKAQKEFDDSLNKLEKEKEALANAQRTLDKAKGIEREAKIAVQEKQKQLNAANAALNSAKVAFDAAQKREQAIALKYQAQYAELQNTNTQLNQATVQQTQLLAKLSEKERELLLANQAKLQAQQDTKIAQAELEKYKRSAATAMPTPSVSKDFEPKMVFVKGGTFQMGDVMGDNEKDDEKPIHSVIWNSFYMGVYEVTQAQWQAVMGNNPSEFKGDNLPVENVSWDDVQVYLKKLNARTGKNYRLPTEAEWEYAAREGGKKVRFGNGKDIANPAEINFDGSEYSKTNYSVAGVYREKTTPVGSFSANSLGLYDMSGNVYEWCSNSYGDYNRDAANNPTDDATGSRRVYRGGSWYFNPSYCLIATRSNSPPSTRSSILGFRVVLSSQ